jgi:hypothetical protein
MDELFVKGYELDGGVDVVLQELLNIRPGFRNYKIKVSYCPEPDEVAFLMLRGSSAERGLLLTPVAIDAGYTGEYLNLPILNVSGDYVRFESGDRAFSIVNFMKAPDRVKVLVKRPNEQRKDKRSGSTNG